MAQRNSLVFPSVLLPLLWYVCFLCRFSGRLELDRFEGPYSLAEGRCCLCTSSTFVTYEMTAPLSMFPSDLLLHSAFLQPRLQAHYK